MLTQLCFHVRTCTFSINWKKSMFAKFLSTRSLFKATSAFCNTTSACCFWFISIWLGSLPTFLSFPPSKNFYSVYLKQVWFIFRSLSNEWKKMIGFMSTAVLDAICCLLSKIMKDLLQGFHRNIWELYRSEIYSNTFDED